MLWAEDMDAGAFELVAAGVSEDAWLLGWAEDTAGVGAADEAVVGGEAESVGDWDDGGEEAGGDAESGICEEP